MQKIKINIQMAQVEFQYEGIIYTIQCQEDQKMSEIFNSFTFKANISENEISYSYNGRVLSQNDKNLTFIQIANTMDKERKKMNILVIKMEIQPEMIIRSKNIICPECNKDIKMKINNRYNIDLYDCINNHKFNNISFDDFERTQMINISKIKCGLCGENKSNTYNNLFYKCYECKIDICPRCQLKHDKNNHIIIDYDKSSYICNKHDESFVNYCKKCKKNICPRCEKDHLNHEKISLTNMIIEKQDLLIKLDEIKNIINVIMKI